jgi:hypothetical protein
VSGCYEGDLFRGLTSDSEHLAFSFVDSPYWTHFIRQYG